MTELEQLKELQELAVDYAGMIFYEGSSRFAGDKLEAWSSAIRGLTIQKVGVFVNAPFTSVLDRVEEYGLDAVQLHGDETDEYCADLMDRTQVIKVFRLTGEEEVDALVDPFQEVCHYFLFDTQLPGDKGQETYGGTGRRFNWEALKRAGIGKPFFLSGGIGLEELPQVKAFDHPFLHAVDVNSRLELRPGVKDRRMVEEFVTGIRTI